MTKSKDYTLTAILLVMGLAVLFNLPACYQSNKPSSNECRFEGAECPNAQHYLRDYQLEYHNDTLWIYDADRLVGTHIDTSLDGINHGSFIDTTVLNDNL